LKKKLSSEFNAFLRDRAKLVVSAMKQLVDGSTPTLSVVWESHDQDSQPKGAEMRDSEAVAVPAD
jgi:hypothetical protein